MRSDYCTRKEREQQRERLLQLEQSKEQVTKIKTDAAAKNQEHERAIDEQIQAAGMIDPPDQEKLKRNTEACKQYILLRLKDPDSAKFDSVIRLGTALKGYDRDSGQSFPAIAYTTSVNAKNSYGGYVGFKSYTCYFDLKEQEVRGLLSPIN